MFAIRRRPDARRPRLLFDDRDDNDHRHSDNDDGRGRHVVRISFDHDHHGSTTDVLDHH